MLGTRAALLPLGLLQGALLARSLGPTGLGRYSAALVDVNLLVTLCALGLPGAVTVLSAERRGTPELGDTVRALWRRGAGLGARTVGVLTLLVAGGAWLAAGQRLPVGVPGGDWLARPAPLLALIVLGVWVQFARDIHNSLLWGAQAFGTQNRLNLGLSLGQLAAVAGLWLLQALTPERAVLLQVLGNAALTAVSGGWLVALLRGLPARRAPFSEDPELAPRARAIGLRNFLHILPDMLLLRIDVYLIQGLLAAQAGRAAAEQQLGLYQAGVRVAELVLMLPGTLNTVLFAKAAARERIEEKTVAGAQLSLCLGLLCLAGMLLLGRPLLVLFYGARFAGSLVPCLWVLLGCAALCFSGPLAGALSGAGGYPRSVVVAQSVALAVNVAANVVLLPRYGITGAAAASALSYAVSAGLISAAYARRFGLPLSALLRPLPPRELWRRLRTD